MERDPFLDVVAWARARAPRPTSTDEAPPAADSTADALMAPIAPERAEQILDRVFGRPTAEAGDACPAEKVVALDARRARRRGLLGGIVAVGGLLAAAASLPFVFQPTDRGVSATAGELADADVGRPVAPPVDPLEFRLELRGGMGRERGEPDPELPLYSACDEIRVLVRPEGHVPDDVEVVLQANKGDRTVDLAWTARRLDGSRVFDVRGSAAELMSGPPVRCAPNAVCHAPTRMAAQAPGAPPAACADAPRRPREQLEAFAEARELCATVTNRGDRKAVRWRGCQPLLVAPLLQG